MISNIFGNIFLGFVQGVTEFIPISSSGHLIIFRDLLNMQVGHGLAYDAVLQLATTVAILVYFHKDFINILKNLFKIFKKEEVDKDEQKLIWAIFYGTLPAVFLGLLLENLMDTVFRNSLLVALSLIVGALIMITAENYYLKLDSLRKINKVRGLKIGFFQSLALIPGMSRSGMTIAGGLFNKIDREQAARFSFILATPILIGSGLKKLIELSTDGILESGGLDLFVGSVVSFVVGLVAIHFLIKFLKTHSLRVFAYYRIVLAALIIALHIV